MKGSDWIARRRAREQRVAKAIGLLPQIAPAKLSCAGLWQVECAAQQEAMYGTKPATHSGSGSSSLR